jgi:hypothetical protein
MRLEKKTRKLAATTTLLPLFGIAAKYIMVRTSLHFYHRGTGRPNSWKVSIRLAMARLSPLFLSKSHCCSMADKKVDALWPNLEKAQTMLATACDVPVENG